MLDKMDISRYTDEEIEEMAEKGKEFKKNAARIRVAAKMDALLKLNRYNQITMCAIPTVRIISFDADQNESAYTLPAERVEPVD